MFEAKKTDFAARRALHQLENLPPDTFGHRVPNRARTASGGLLRLTGGRAPLLLPNAIRSAGLPWPVDLGHKDDGRHHEQNGIGEKEWQNGIGEEE